MTIANKLGASAYALWGALHAYVGGSALLAASSGSAQGALVVLADRAPPSAAAGLEPSVMSLIAQHAFNLLWIGCAALVIAVALNWRGSRTGYWLNLALISLADIGFVTFVVVPGHISPAFGLPGPALWLTGACLTTLGMWPVLRRPGRSAITPHQA